MTQNNMKEKQENTNENKLLSKRRKKTKSKTLGKPKRALSAYNFFFQHERALILGIQTQQQHKPDNIVHHDKENYLFQHSQHQNKRKMEHFEQQRKQGCQRNRIGFSELAKTIAKKWKSIDRESKAQYEYQAELDRERYDKEIEIYEQKKYEERINKRKRRILLEREQIMEQVSSSHYFESSTKFHHHNQQHYQSFEMKEKGRVQTNKIHDWNEWCKEELKIYQDKKKSKMMKTTVSGIFPNQTDSMDVEGDAIFCNPSALVRRKSSPESNIIQCQHNDDDYSENVNQFDPFSICDMKPGSESLMKGCCAIDSEEKEAIFNQPTAEKILDILSCASDIMKNEICSAL